MSKQTDESKSKKEEEDKHEVSFRPNVTSNLICSDGEEETKTPKPNLNYRLVPNIVLMKSPSVNNTDIKIKKTKTPKPNIDYRPVPDIVQMNSPLVNNADIKKSEFNLSQSNNIFSAESSVRNSAEDLKIPRFESEVDERPP